MSIFPNSTLHLKQYTSDITNSFFSRVVLMFLRYFLFDEKAYFHFASIEIPTNGKAWMKTYFTTWFVTCYIAENWVATLKLWLIRKFAELVFFWFIIAAFPNRSRLLTKISHLNIIQMHKFEENKVLASHICWNV